MRHSLGLVLVVFLAAGCSQDESPAAEKVTIDPAIYTAAVAAPGRTDRDRDRDVIRKPDQVLAFLEIAPGMTVLDMFSGGGYYTEILANVVGENGRVVAQSNSAYLNFVGEEFEARHADNRLANVDILMAENNELQLDENSFDAITIVLGYHDVYYIDVEVGWPKIDVTALNAELYKALKPGGVLGIADHYAEAGSARETGSTLHRIDPQIVIEDLTAAGFVLVGKSDVLTVDTDDYTKSVFDPAVRGNTNRFLLRFTKPE